MDNISTRHKSQELEVQIPINRSDLTRREYLKVSAHILIMKRLHSQKKAKHYKLARNYSGEKAEVFLEQIIIEYFAVTEYLLKKNNKDNKKAT